eukprot:NODE_15742_length_414_cov_3.292096_g15430_i0.p1 GENE.NODE_15742_length_414_cov_3.292096_g15430_i0~~NODE_15742_length_414_cov_3.292096_g15430_i0.p1  ORF type:complete len:100 (+),score=21.14 NODE_15742_length_414_cov_3.292096_g15430_i0:2-301(+)
MELDLTYRNMFEDLSLPEAYEGLIYDCCCGNQRNFVRTDELEAAWTIFTPILKEIEDKEVDPIKYEWGSRGPKEADELAQRCGYMRNAAYKWRQPKYIA